VELSDTVLGDSTPQAGGKTHFDIRDSILQAEDFLRAQIWIALAGTAAEQVGLGGKSFLLNRCHARALAVQVAARFYYDGSAQF
jgi:hypothetical protein